MNTNPIKETLKFIQILCVLMIPIVAVQFYFPILDFLDFAAPINSFFQSTVSNFVDLNINGTDWTLVAIVVPWILFIILIDFLMRFLDNLSKKAEATYVSYKTQMSNAIIAQQAQEQKNVLQKKQIVYVALQLVYSKFTISTLSDEEMDYKKDEIKDELIRDLEKYRGKMLDDEKFDDNDTFALMFFSQDDAINFIIKLKEIVLFLDNDLQPYGYSLAFKALMDSQGAEVMKFYILQFLERALRTNELNEIGTTNDFARRYKEFGKMKNIDFVSKGNYSINKERVEIFRLVY